MSINSPSDPSWHLTDALSEDILNTGAEDLFGEVAEDHQDRRALVTEFDRIFDRGLRRVRRQELKERLKQFIDLPWPAPRFATASIGALAAIAIAVGAAITAFQPTSNVGYVEIKTVPVALVTQTALYIEFHKDRADQEGQHGPAPYDRYTQVAGRRRRWFFGAALRHRGEAEPHYHRDNFRIGASSALPMPLWWRRCRARVRELMCLGFPVPWCA